ncbi:flagella-associated protein 58 [Acrasis kona]|uniref:Flagella-associated protein 58 n=1 Tax=Acrasis kona TaxID=1008807 RepID=A0AAW2YH96_9EUKA
MTQTTSYDLYHGQQMLVQDIDLSMSAWSALEEEFREVVAELNELPQMNAFRIEYERLFKVLLTSHTHEIELRKRCEEFNQDIISTVTKVQQSLSTLKEDEQLIAQLKREIEKTWEHVDQSREKELKDLEQLNKLIAKERTLSQEIKDGLPTHKTTAIEENEQLRDKLQKDRDAFNSEVIVLIKEVSNLEVRVKNFNTEKKSYLTHIQEMTEELSQFKTEYNEQIKAIDAAELGLKKTKFKLETKNNDIFHKESSIERGCQKINELEQELKEQSQITQKAEKECETAEHRREKIDRDLKEQIKQNSKLYAENEELRDGLSTKEAQIKVIKEQQIITQKTITAFIKRRKELEERRDKLEDEKNQITEEYKNILVDLNQMKRQFDVEKAKIEDLSHQKSILSKNINKSELDVEKLKNSRKIVEGNRKNVITKQKGYSSALEELRVSERRLKKETDKYMEELQIAHQKHEQAIEEAKIKKRDTEEYQEKIRDGLEKLKQQQSLLEQVRNEKNQYSKLMNDANAEINLMTKSKKVMNEQIKKLRAEIEKRQDELLDQSRKKESIKIKIEKHMEQIKKMDDEIKEQESINRQHENEIYKLNQIIKDADTERKRQQKEFESVMNDRDILGAKLIKGNDELALLYEKIKSQQSALSKGSVQYMEKVMEIDTLKFKIRELHKKKVELSDEISALDDLKTEVHRLERELLQENMRNRALQDELENPMNVHRWRKLEGSDPQSYEMIQKIQKLQKKLIKKTEEVMMKDMLIQQKEKLYVELKEVLIRQPGPEVAEQLTTFQSTLKNKTKECRKMKEELKASMLLAKEQQYEHERLQAELSQIKSQYYQQRKAEQRQRSYESGAYDDHQQLEQQQA